MAGRGPTPKATDTRRSRRTPSASVGTPVAAPALPDADSYSARTRDWYAVWTSSPQAAHFTATDWQRLHMLAPLVELYFKEPSRNLFAEIRLNEAKLGATPEDRLRLSWRLESPAEDAPGAASRHRPDPRLNPS